MSFTDKVKNKAEELTGKAKEDVGDATDNERMQGRGPGRPGDLGATPSRPASTSRTPARDVKDALS